jgi:iron complex transport system permease protein
VTTHAGAIRRPTAARVRRVRLRMYRRRIAVLVLLADVAFALFVLSLALGSSQLGPLLVLESLFGVSTDPGVDFIVLDLRLPLAASALAVGLALGIAGTVFQRLLANPLASPELTGVSAGASLAAVTGIVLFSFSGYETSLAAVIGAVAGAALIYALAWREGIDGYRLILIGIGVSELMLAIIAYLIARADLHAAREAMHWLVGSIGQAGTSELRALLLGLAVLGPLALVLERSLRALELGDDPARALGVRIEAARLGLIAVAVALVGLATAIAGPLAFVALVAGPIAARLLGEPNGGIVAAACVGASVVLAADLVAQQVLPVALPTGVVTGAIGAPYLLWALVALNRTKGAA